MPQPGPASSISAPQARHRAIVELLRHRARGSLARPRACRKIAGCTPRLQRAWSRSWGRQGSIRARLLRVERWSTEQRALGVGVQPVWQGRQQQGRRCRSGVVVSHEVEQVSRAFAALGAVRQAVSPRRRVVVGLALGLLAGIAGGGPPQWSGAAPAAGRRSWGRWRPTVLQPASASSKSVAPRRRQEEYLALPGMSRAQLCFVVLDNRRRQTSDLPMKHPRCSRFASHDPAPRPSPTRSTPPTPLASRPTT